MTRGRERRTANKRHNRIGDVVGLAALGLFVWVLFSWSEFEPDLYRGEFIAAADRPG